MAGAAIGAGALVLEPRLEAYESARSGHPLAGARLGRRGAGLLSAQRAGRAARADLTGFRRGRWRE
jgi:hypothetical protein